MSDSTPASAPRDWRDALAALPPESPPSGGWRALSARLDARTGVDLGATRTPSRRWPVWAASAAALALAIALPWRQADEAVPAPRQATAADPATVAVDPLEQLYAESAQLESLLAVARDDRVASATAAVLGAALAEQLAAIDAMLARPGLSRDAQLSLWQQRVEGLRTFTGFESNRRWLAAQGARYDAALVLVD